jgi:hypothetical protein
MGDFESRFEPCHTGPTSSAASSAAIHPDPLADLLDRRRFGTKLSCRAPWLGARQSLCVAQKHSETQCALCAHPLLRIGSYIGRIGSGPKCFLEFPLFARAGMRFESHALRYGWFRMALCGCIARGSSKSKFAGRRRVSTRSLWMRNCGVTDLPPATSPFR